VSDQSDARPSTPRRPTVIVVDADRRVRDGLVGLLGCDGRVALAGSAAHAEAALSLAAAVDPDVMLIDPRLPEVTDGIALIERLRAAVPGLRVLVLAWSGAIERALGGDPLVAVVSASADADDLVDLLVGTTHASPGTVKADARIRECA
jgi:DNA-binding NarL/FixJ family response regulator